MRVCGCGEEIAEERIKLGYVFCLECGEEEAGRIAERDHVDHDAVFLRKKGGNAYHS